jgi:hypothetical protein
MNLLYKPKKDESVWSLPILIASSQIGRCGRKSHNPLKVSYGNSELVLRNRTEKSSFGSFKTVQQITTYLGTATGL